MSQKAEDTYSDYESYYLWNPEQAANPVCFHFSSGQ